MGENNMSNSTLTIAKSNWKRRVKGLMDTLGKVFEDVMYGRRPNMFELLTFLERVDTTAMFGVGLHGKMLEARFSKRTLQDLNKTLRKLELAAQHLVGICEKYGMPVGSTPQFVNPLLNEEADPETTYEDMMSTQDRGGVI
jgi:hypothetical protein